MDEYSRRMPGSLDTNLMDAFHGATHAGTLVALAQAGVETVAHLVTFAEQYRAAVKHGRAAVGEFRATYGTDHYQEAEAVGLLAYWDAFCEVTDGAA